MSKKYFIRTYGCQMNVHESEKIAGILRESGYLEAEDIESCDIVVLNTCCIRETAETRVLGNLSIIKKIKERNPGLIVVVTGCMPQKDDTAERLKKRCPFINLILGTHNLYKLGEYLSALSDKSTGIEIWSKERGIEENTPIYRTSNVNAWVNIMYGCDNFCSYCIVPYVKGRERSRRKDDILNDVKNLLSEGYKEITLLGQNVNSYGNDEHSTYGFAALLSDISAIGGEFIIRFMTSHPKDLNEDVVKVISYSDKIGDFIHLPVQSGSSRVLHMMNRKYSRDDYIRKIDLIRKYIPHAGLSSDIMVGFPGETEEDFMESVKLAEEMRFNNLYTFIYSRRSGTVAHKMEDQIELAIKKDRIKRLIEAQNKISAQIARECEGKTYRVLCDSYKNGVSGGKSSCGKAVTFETDKNMTGRFVDVKIVKSRNSKLYGEISEE